MPENGGWPAVLDGLVADPDEAAEALARARYRPAEWILPHRRADEPVRGWKIA